MVKTQTSALNIAETVLRMAARSKHPREQAIAELGTYADLAEKEAPGNPYSVQLMNVVAALEAGASAEQALRVARNP
jgi:hypothetical protein